MTPANPSKTTTADSDTLVVLVVGDMTEPRQPGEIGPAGVDLVAPTDLAARLAGREAPALVLSPLSGRGFDAVTIAQTLQAVAYRGVYYATTRALPDPALVRAEVTRVAPDLVFDLLFPDDMAWLMRAARG